MPENTPNSMQFSCVCVTLYQLCRHVSPLMVKCLNSENIPSRERKSGRHNNNADVVMFQYKT